MGDDGVMMVGVALVAAVELLARLVLRLNSVAGLPITGKLGTFILLPFVVAGLFGVSLWAEAPVLSRVLLPSAVIPVLVGAPTPPLGFATELLTAAGWPLGGTDTGCLPEDTAAFLLRDFFLVLPLEDACLPLVVLVTPVPVVSAEAVLLDVVVT